MLTPFFHGVSPNTIHITAFSNKSKIYISEISPKQYLFHIWANINDASIYYQIFLPREYVKVISKVFICEVICKIISTK